MTTAAPSAALATIQPVFTDAERLALAGASYADCGRRIAAGLAGVALAARPWAGDLARTAPGDRHGRE